MKKFKQDDVVRVLNPCCTEHEYGSITDMIPIKTPFGDAYEVRFDVSDENSIKEELVHFIDNELELFDKEAFIQQLLDRVFGVEKDDDACILLHDGCNVVELPRTQLQVKAEKTPYKVVEDNGVTYIDLGNGVRMFESGAVRSVNTGKPRFDLISELAMKWLAECLAKNGGEYGTGNYLLGIPEEVCVESLERHLNTVKIGLRTGNESLVDEAANLLCNAMFLCHTIQLKKHGLYKVSDRFKSIVDGQTGESKAA